jgi:hypothetical protein
LSLELSLSIYVQVEKPKQVIVIDLRILKEDEGGFFSYSIIARHHKQKEKYFILELQKTTQIL